MSSTGIDAFRDKHGVTHLLSFPDGQFVGVIIYIIGKIQIQQRISCC